MSLTRQLLITLNNYKLPSLAETVKGIGMFLTSAGEAIYPGAIDEARKIRLEVPPGGALVSPKVSTSLSLMGDTIMDWSASLRVTERRLKNASRRDKRVSKPDRGT